MEHNFGMQTKKVLNASWHELYWTNAEFHPRMNLAQGPDLLGFPGMATYDLERDRFIYPRAARDAASSGYKAFAAEVNSTLRQLSNVRSVESMSHGLTEVDVTDPAAMMLHDPTLSVAFDTTTGAIESMLETTAAGGKREWVAHGHRLAEFVYRTYTQRADINPYIDVLTPDHPTSDKDMRIWPWSKPGMDAAIEADPAMPPLTNCSRAWPVRLTRAWKSATTMLLQLALPDAAVQLFGGMREVTLNVTLATADETGGRAVEVTLTWRNKTATRLAESSWLSFVPAVPRPETGWRLDVLGTPVDPLSVAYNGSRHLHAIHRGVCYDDTVTSNNDDDDDANNGTTEADPIRLALESLDAPLVAPGDTAHLLDFDNVLPDLSGGFHFNLHNNAGWDQSAPQWYGRDAAFRFRLNLNAPAGCWRNDPAAATAGSQANVLPVLKEQYQRVLGKVAKGAQAGKPEWLRKKITDAGVVPEI